MAFWMDPLIMIAAGALLAWVVKWYFDGNDFAVYAGETAVLCVAYFVAVGFFLNIALLRPVWTALGAETGTAFMINGLVFHLVAPGTVWTDLGPGAMFTAIVLFAVYPFWLRLGVVVGRLAFGRHPRQEGLVGLVRP